MASALSSTLPPAWQAGHMQYFSPAAFAFFAASSAAGSCEICFASSLYLRTEAWCLHYLLYIFLYSCLSHNCYPFSI